MLEGSWSDDEFVNYLDRRADLGQMLALVRTIAWLRAQAVDADAVPTALSRRPASLGLLRQPVYDAARDRLSIPLHDSKRWPRFEVTAGIRGEAVH